MSLSLCLWCEITRPTIKPQQSWVKIHGSHCPHPSHVINRIEMKLEKSLTRGVNSQFLMFGNNLLNFNFRAKVVRGESPLRRVRRPWILLQQLTIPASYSSSVIVTQTDFPITNFGGSLVS